MKTIISLNVNGIRAAHKRGLKDFIKKYKPDYLGLNEVRGNEDKIPKDILDLNYNIYWNNSAKAGYAGTGILVKSSLEQPKEIYYGINEPNAPVDDPDKEGRALTLVFSDLVLVSVYVPNSGEGLKFKERRKRWNIYFKDLLQELKDEKKKVVVMGDFNVARFDTDVYDGTTNKNRSKTAGFTPYEREHFEELIKLGYTDLFEKKALKNPADNYTFWSYRGRNMKKNKKGWRLDYFLLYKCQAKTYSVLQEYDLSDHCPILMKIK